MFESYHSILILVVSIILYGGTFFLFKRGRISLLTHRRIWNVILLVTFLISATLGVLLAILLDLDINFSWYFELLWFHVEFGVAMAIVSLFHISWHWKYFSLIFKKKNE